MRKMRIAQKIVYMIPFFLLTACAEEEEKVAPVVEIVSPQDNATLKQGDIIPIKAIAEDGDGTIVEVTIFVEGEEMASSDESTFIYNWNTADYEVGEYALGALAVDDDDKYDSDNITILLDSPGGFNPDLTYGTMSDFEGNTYATIDIGGQVWMAENLRVTHYADGTPITELSDDAEWDALTADAQVYCWYENLSSNEDTSSVLYTWAAAMAGGTSSDTIPSGVQGVCPDGWHLPSDAEWKEFELFVGMDSVQVSKTEWRGSDEGAQLKETGYSKWQSAPAGGNNTSGFTAVPGGFRSATGTFYNYHQYAAYWTATHESGTGKAWYRALKFDSEQVYRQYNTMTMGFSVRCVQD
ncbi:MAG: FISUMP domain-containing protein [Bacteroidota bacterium]|nr:FISUMP domain-containing protein [Bacteroidota bacterium]